MVIGAIMAVTQSIKGKPLPLWLPIILVGVALFIRFTTNILDDNKNNYPRIMIYRLQLSLVRRIAVYIAFISLVFAFYVRVFDKYWIEGFVVFCFVPLLGLITYEVIHTYLEYRPVKKR